MVEKIRIKTRHFIAIIVVSALVILVPVFFQNCAAPIEDRADLGSVANSAPFAYETKIDHFAYMSCANMASGYNTNAYFTFKAGAYRDGAGVKLTDDYVYATRNLLVDDKARALAASPLNRDVYAQLGIRPAANLQTIFQSGSLYYGDFLGSFSDTAAANELARVNGASYTRMLGTTPFEDSVHITTSEALALQIRNEVSTNGNYVAFGYSRTSSNPAEAVSSPAGSTTSVFGVGYRMAFTLGAGQSSNYSTGNMRVMTNLNEFNLQNQQLTSSNWECNPNWVFMIIKPGDVGVRALCENHETEPTPTAAQTEMYDVLRKVLPATYWGVNLNRRCIVPKTAATGSCYGSSTALINYNGGACDSVTGTCPHYVSICKRR